MKILLLLLCPCLAFSQIDTVKWWISNVPAWPVSQSNQASTCMLGTQTWIDSGSYLSVGLNGTSSVCHDTNLDGSLKTGPLTENNTGSLLLANTFNFLYGTVEFRVKTPNSNTSWPAVWLLGTICQATYPHSVDYLGTCTLATNQYNEIDILESIGNPGATALSVYQPSVGDPVHMVVSIDITQWHVFSLVWSAGSLVLSIDGTVSATITGAIVPSTAMFPVFDNIAVAGRTAPGQLAMLVDYIRISQNGVLVFDDEFGGYSRVLGGALTKQ